MKIAIMGIKQLPATAGADRVVEKLIEYLPKDDHYYIYLNEGFTPYIRSAENLHYIYIPSLEGKHLRAFTYFFLCIVHYLWKGNYDIVHVHNSDFGLFCPFLRLRPRTKVIGTFHGNPYERQKWSFFAKKYLQLSEILFIHSCHKLTSVSRYKIHNRKEIKYIPNGTEEYLFDEKEKSLPDELNEIKNREYLFFACGRLDPTKGLHTLISAYLNGKFSIKLLVIGDFGHDKTYSEQIEEESGKKDQIILYKKLVPKDTLLNILNGCRLFIFPSQIEAMSMMLLEAVSCKKVVVCSDIKENIEIVGPTYPFLFRVNDSIDLERKIKNALSDENSQDIVDRLHDECIKTFSWPAIAKQYHTLYANVIDS